MTVLSLRTCHSSRVSAPRCTLHIRTARGAGSKRTPQWLAEGFHPKGHVHRAVL